MPIRLNEDEFSDLVTQAMETLPEEFGPYMENISVEIQPRPTREFMKEHFLEGSPNNLLGLYSGVALPNKSVNSVVDWPERIFIFQKNIEAICDSREDIIDQVQTTVLHEVGHHFGMDEDDLAQYGYD